eukprot:PITA_21112
MNATFIALIPKEAQSNTPDKYRPISLCNVMYKIVSKIVASRLKLLLPFLISLEQSRYVERRQITDGIILTHEIIHSLKNSKRSGMLLKIDLSKAFDSLSWESHHFNSIFLDFLDASWAKINKAKSQLFFFDTPAITRASIARILGFSIASLPSKYLGAPLTDSALKHSSRRLLLEKLEACLSSWTHRALNMTSRLVLIKAVLQSMSLYLFSILAASKWVLKDIRCIQRSFLWGNTEKKCKWALVKWDTIFLTKSVGGTGLHDPFQNNIVMGARIWWKWLTMVSTPWANIWTARYANSHPTEEII